MITKRLLAVAAALVMVAGAIVLRRAVIDADDAPEATSAADEPAPTDAVVLTCAAELAEICRAAALDTALDTGLDVSIAEAGATVDALAEGAATDPVLWVTFDPFPQMVDVEREAGSRPALGLATSRLASSEVTLVSSPTVGEAVAGCGDPAEWRCVAELDVTIGFARSTDSAIGLLGVADAAYGYAAGGSIPLDDITFQRWFRDVVASVPSSKMSGDTAIETVRRRPSAMDVAVGAVAELGNPPADQLVAAYAEPVMQADVVIAAGSGVAIPDGLADRLQAALTDAGWDAAAPSDGLPDAGTLIALRQLWKDSS